MVLCRATSIVVDLRVFSIQIKMHNAVFITVYMSTTKVQGANQNVLFVKEAQLKHETCSRLHL